MKPVENNGMPKKRTFTSEGPAGVGLWHPNVDGMEPFREFSRTVTHRAPARLLSCLVFFSWRYRTFHGFHRKLQDLAIKLASTSVATQPANIS